MINSVEKQLAKYNAPFRLLASDLERALEFVHPTDGNEAVFSFRLYDLLLRGSTEFESVCREACEAIGAKLPSEPRIGDYAILVSRLSLVGTEVGLAMWQPRPRFIRPLLGWEEGKHSLSWYQDYNMVKHQRSGEFRRASLENVLHALGALFLVLAGARVFPPISHVHHADLVEHTYTDLPFTVRLAGDWPPQISVQEGGLPVAYTGG